MPLELPKIGINSALRETVQCDPNLSFKAKFLFVVLTSVKEDTQTMEGVQAVAELIQRNYIWIESFGAVPDPAKNRTSWQLRIAGLKQIFTGKPE